MLCRICLRHVQEDRAELAHKCPFCQRMLRVALQIRAMYLRGEWRDIDQPELNQIAELPRIYN